MQKEAYLLLFFLLLPTSTASILFDGEVDDYETFKAGAHSFYVEYVESTQGVVFKMDDMGGIMEIGECETKEDIRYCVENVDYPKIWVKIEFLEPDISIERTFSTTSPNVGEQITVTVILKNDGDKRASNIKYTDAYPSGLRAYGEGNAKVWEGSLNTKEEERFTYSIKAEEALSFESTAKLSYKFDGTEKTITSSTETIEVKKPFSISHQISKEAADRDEIINYSITIENKEEYKTLYIQNLEINLPSKIDIIKPVKGLVVRDNQLTFKGEIEKQQSQTFTVKIKSSKVGKFTIQTAVELRISNNNYKEELQKQFNIGLTYILPILNVTDTVKSNSAYPIYIAVKNHGDDEIKNVKIKAESDLFDNIEKTRNIAAGSTYEVIDKTFTSPYTEEDQKHNIKISGSYISSSGRTYTFEKSAQLTITAAPKVIEIIKEFNKEEFYPGDEIKVAVKIKNKRNTALNEVDVSDIFPQEIRASLLGDVIGYLDELGPNEEKKLYSYSVVVPEDYTGDEIEFKTNLNVKVDGELVILKRTDNVKILKGEKSEEVEGGQGISDEETGETNQTEQETTQTEEIKENFFKKIINWVKNLFTKDK